VQRARDDYFVRVEAAPTAAPTRSRRGGRSPIPSDRYDPDPEPKPRHRHRRKRANRKAWFLTFVLLGVGSWAIWAGQQPGGVSGTVNGWIDHVRGSVENASTGRALGPAAKYYNDQFKATGQYPQLTDDQMANAGISIDVDVRVCSSDAVVLQTLTVSRLLVAGTDLGEVSGRQPCPTDFSNPAPWHLKS
jgi:hypothetical protein